MEKVLTALPWSTIFICGNKSLAMSTRVIIVRWFSLESPIVERKYFHHPTAFVITKDIFPMGQGIKVFFE